MIITKKSNLTILLPENATPREQFAAEELSTYLTKIFSCRVRITSDNVAVTGDIFVIGGPMRNTYAARLISEADFCAAVPGPEGMLIKSYGNAVLLAGSHKDPVTERERGTIYAVYAFLERYLGVSLAAPYEESDAGVRPMESADISDISYCKPCADLPYRTAIMQYGDSQGNPDHALNVQFLNWLVRNRYNRILTWSGIYDGYKKNKTLDEAIKRGFLFSAGHHAASKLFLPPHGNADFPEKYYETHPEYYKLTKDGTRFYSEDFKGQWIFCSRNEDCIEEVSKNIITWISQNPAVDIIAFWPQDGIDDQCTCEKCQKHSKIENYTYFLNAVAKRVSRVHPHVKIDMLAYVDLWDPPKNMELAPCLMIDEATWHTSGLRKGGAPDGSAIIGTLFEDTLLKWKALGAEVVFYDYYMAVYGARNRLVPIADEIPALSRHYAAKGIGGSGTQIECFNLWNHLFNFYSFARSMYDTSLSMEDLLLGFVRIFGEGGKYVAEVIRKLEDTVDNQTDLMKTSLYLMETIDKEEIYALYEKALEEAKTPLARNAVRMMRMVFRYTDLECYEYGLCEIPGYQWLRPYPDETGELYHMSKYDSFLHHNPGRGIMIPVDCKETDTFTPDKWYTFE